MSPGPRRDRTRFVVALSVGAVVLFLVVGGLASVGRSSGPYRQSVNASFGAEASVVATQSDVVGTDLNALVAALPTLDRADLSMRLDLVVSEGQRVASSAEQMSAPAAPNVGSEFEAAMASRTRALMLLRSSVDGLLSITPASQTFPPPSVGAAGAIRTLTRVGQLLVSADSSYGAARAAFVRAPGGFRLPASVWVPQPELWGSGAVSTLVDLLTASPVLAPSVDVHVVAVALQPSLLPPVPPIKGQAAGPPLPQGAVSLPPTCTLAVTAVVRNDGSIVVTKVPVQASVQPVSGGAPFVVTKPATLAPGASVALALPVMAVRPNTTYALTVSLTPPAGQSAPVGQAGATVTVASFGSAAADAACSRTPAAAP